MQLAKMDSEHEMRLVSDAKPHKSEYFEAREKWKLQKAFDFKGLSTGWERPTSDSSRDNSSGRTGRRWTTPCGEVANPIHTA
jgi:hypothetical protein